MAAGAKSLFSVARFSVNTLINSSKRSRICMQMVPTRAITCTETGAILPKPEQTRFGVLKSLLVVMPFLYFGGSFASRCAALLEDYELFVPLDDDDD